MSIGRRLSVESNNTFQRTADVFCARIIDDKSFRLKVYNIVQHDRDYIKDNFSGRLSEVLLIKLIIRSYFDQKIREMLPLVVDSISNDSISNAVFKKLRLYKWRKTREDVVVALCHKKLPVNMLKELCRLNKCFECYFELAIEIYSNELHTVAELQEVMCMFLESPFAEMLPELLREMESYKMNDKDKNTLIQMLWESDGPRKMR